MKSGCWACGNPAPGGVCMRPHPAINWWYAHDRGYVSWSPGYQVWHGNHAIKNKTGRTFGPPAWARTVQANG